MVAGGCYYDMRFPRADCFNSRFEADEFGTSVRMHPVHSPSGSINRAGGLGTSSASGAGAIHSSSGGGGSGGGHSACFQVDAVHNFFVGRTAALRHFRWDERQKVMEHETFFYQLFLNQQPVFTCPSVSVAHNTTRDDEYRERSFRHKVALAQDLPLPSAGFFS